MDDTNKIHIELFALNRVCDWVRLPRSCVTILKLRIIVAMIHISLSFFSSSRVPTFHFYQVYLLK